MSARRRVISTDEIQFNHKPAKMLLTKKKKKKGVSQNGQTPNIIGICSYCVPDRPVFEWNQVLLHPELTPWWSFLFANGTHHKKETSQPHPPHSVGESTEEYNDGLEEDCSISSALSMEMLQSCAKPSIFHYQFLLPTVISFPCHIG